LAPGVGSGNGEYGFLPFLAAVQMLEIDFLPIIWDAARQGLGSGATSTVDEWLVDLKTSFAFKRVHSSSKRARREVEIYRTLINEISVLGHPSVRENLYIAQLLGICWDVSSDDITPWPVLVFEKSQFGDLYHFMTQSDGRSMGIKERIALFVDIGTAIRDMHSKGKWFISFYCQEDLRN
jgi:hypothetical protein